MSFFSETIKLQLSLRAVFFFLNQDLLIFTLFNSETVLLFPSKQLICKYIYSLLDLLIPENGYINLQVFISFVSRSFFYE